MRIDLSKFENIRDQLLTVGFLIVAIFLMVLRQDDSFQNLRKASLMVVSVMETPLSNVRVYRTALQTNTELERQNILLQDEISRLRTLRDENEALRQLLGLRDSLVIELYPVRIVTKNLTGINNNMTINAGTTAGIETGMPVLNAEGLIGQVTLAGRRYSKVLPIYSNEFRVSAMIEGSRAYGIVKWEGWRGSELTLRYVPQTINVEPGMRVKTSGLSYQFPFGIPIGEVTETEPEPGKETQIIYIRPYASMFTVAEAHVMLYKPDDELIELQEEWEGIR